MSYGRAIVAQIMGRLGSVRPDITNMESCLVPEVEIRYVYGHCLCSVANCWLCFVRYSKCRSIPTSSGVHFDKSVNSKALDLSTQKH